MEYDLCTQIRQAILKQRKPFCISDLYIRLKNITDNKKLILKCLDELYDEGLIDYRQIKRDFWAFVVS